MLSAVIELFQKPSEVEKLYYHENAIHCDAVQKLIAIAAKACKCKAYERRNYIGVTAEGAEDRLKPSVAYGSSVHGFSQGQKKSAFLFYSY